MAAGAEYCLAGDKAVRSAQLLLFSLEFDGRGDYANALESEGMGETASFLTE